MRPDFLREAESAAPELLALRRELHRCPELGNREFETARRVEQYLNGLGIETFRLLDTAVVGILRGGRPGKTVGLRADMDALPLNEDTGVEWASEKPGVMHACGHDVHMTSALGAAKLLSAHRESLPGTVRFFFQPDEEDRGGARRMIDAGCLGDTEAVFGCHVDPKLPAGTVGVRYGKFYAASDTFAVTVRGVTSHGAVREMGIDALAAAAELTLALLALPERLQPERSVVTVGVLHAGTADNILPGAAELKGIIRTLGADSRKRMEELFRETVAAVAAKTGTEIELWLRHSHGGIVNEDSAAALVQTAAESLLGKDRVAVLHEPLMISEDFGCFVDAAGGAFYHVGAGCPAALHSPQFLPADGAVTTAAAVHAAVLWDWLKTRERSDKN